jgi:hypothetical protein
MSNRSFFVVAVVFVILLMLFVVIHRPRAARSVHGAAAPHGDLR